MDRGALKGSLTDGVRDAELVARGRLLRVAAQERPVVVRVVVRRLLVLLFRFSLLRPVNEYRERSSTAPVLVLVPAPAPAHVRRD
jgi:hypothetical protein